MRKISDYIYVGSDADIEEFLDLHPDGCLIHAAKEPFHRRFVGYSGRGCPKSHKEYYSALRGTELALNLIDPDDKMFVADECFIKACKYLDEWYEQGKVILVHCNQGRSRSPAIIFYHMCQYGLYQDCTFEEAIDDFEEHIYPEFNPSRGIRDFLKEVFPYN